MTQKSARMNGTAMQKWNRNKKKKRIAWNCDTKVKTDEREQLCKNGSEVDKNGRISSHKKLIERKSDTKKYLA